jgi:hypothetical protein
MLLIVSTAGCVEVKDRPANGPFTIRLEMPPMLLVNDTGGQLAGPLAQVETELENKTPAYSWDIDGDGIADLNGSRVHYPNGTIDIHVAHYIVTYYGQQRAIPLFLAGSGRAAVADALFLENASLASVGVRTPLIILGGNDLRTNTEGPLGITFDGVRNPPTGFHGMYISLWSNASGPSTYVAGFVWDVNDPYNTSMGAFRIWPGERHHVECTDDGQMLLNVTTQSGTTVVYSGSAGDAPANRTARLGVLEWTGRVGEEPTPGPGALAAAVALVCATVALARHRARLMRAS